MIVLEEKRRWLCWFCLRRGPGRCSVRGFPRRVFRRSYLEWIDCQKDILFSTEFPENGIFSFFTVFQLHF
jgi:hypothetical protein